MYGDKFSFQNRLGQPYSWKKKLPFLLCFTSYLRAIFQVQATGGAYIWRGDLTVGFCVTGLGAYIWRGSFLEFYGIQLLRSFSFLIQTRVHTRKCHVTSLIFSEGDIWGWVAGGGGEGLPYKSDGDAHCLAYGGQLQNLVSLRVFGTKSHYIGPFTFLTF